MTERPKDPSFAVATIAEALVISEKVKGLTYAGINIPWRFFKFAARAVLSLPARGHPEHQFLEWVEKQDKK